MRSEISRAAMRHEEEADLASLPGTETDFSKDASMAIEVRPYKDGSKEDPKKDQDLEFLDDSLVVEEVGEVSTRKAPVLDKNVVGIMEGLEKAEAMVTKEEKEKNVERLAENQRMLLAKSFTDRVRLEKKKAAIIKETAQIKNTYFPKPAVEQGSNSKSVSAELSKNSAETEKARLQIKLTDAKLAYTKAFREYSGRAMMKMEKVGRGQDAMVALDLRARVEPPFTAAFSKKGEELRRLYVELQEAQAEFDAANTQEEK